MSKFTKRAITIMVLLCITISIAPFSAFATDDTATREYTIHHLIRILFDASQTDLDVLKEFKDQNSISEYSKNSIAKAISSNILTGYEDKTIRPKDAILRVEALVLLSRALPEDLDYKEQEIYFTDIPTWAKNDVSKLTKLGLVKGYGNGLVGAEDQITIEQVGFLVERLKSFYPLRIEDDFYSQINADWLAVTKVDEENPANSPIISMDQMVIEKEMEIVKGLLNPDNSLTLNSKEKKLINYFKLAYDFEVRNKEGISYLKNPINDILSSKSISNLQDVLAELQNKYGFESLFPIHIMEDMNDSSKYGLYLYESEIGLSKSYYLENSTSKIKKAYLNYLKYILKISGFEEVDADKLSQKIYDFEYTLANAKLDYEDYYNSDLVNNTMKISDLNNLIPRFNMTNYFNAIHINSDRIIVENPELLKILNNSFTEENLPVLKGYLVFSLLNKHAMDLTKDIADEYFKLTTELYGYDTKRNELIIAFYELENMFGTEIGELYLKKYFSSDTKDAITKMANELINTFSKRIMRNTWLSESSKIYALSKLSTLIPQVGGPENYYDYFEDINIDYTGSGGYLKKKIEINTYFSNDMKNAIGYEVNRNSFLLYPTTVNAAYIPTRNVIVIPAGILMEPAYDKNASYEENLGAIGSIIAHEITHALDNNGAKYDKYGTVKNWWTEADFQKFNELSNRVKERFDSFYLTDNLKVDGAQTLSENIADLGAIRIITDLAQEKNLDLKKVYTSYAELWRGKYTDEYIKMMLSNDTHAPDILRVNGILPNLDEFLEAFQIEENDEMYLKEEDRIEIW